MQFTIDDQVLAIAAGLSALRNADSLAKKGYCDDRCCHAIMSSIFVIDSKNVKEIYPEPKILQPGYAALLHLANPNEIGETQHILSYFASCTQLAKRLQKNRSAQEIIRNRLTQHQYALADYKNDPAPLNNAVAQLYTDCISPLKPRIHVKGVARHLGQANNQAQIRALLFGSIRACYLWRQMGGRLWRLPLQRQTFVQAAKSAIDE